MARSGEKLKSLAARLTSETGRSVKLIPADLGDKGALAQVEAVLREDKSITMLVNNAGSAALAPLLDSNVDQMEAMITLNVTALTRLTYAAAPAFVARGAGTIINIGSVVGIVPERLEWRVRRSKALSLPSLSRCNTSSRTKASASRRCCPPRPRPTSREKGGFHHSKLPAGTVMSTEDMVDAALAGLDRRRSGDDSAASRWRRLDALRCGAPCACAKPEIRHPRRGIAPPNPLARALNARKAFEDRAMASRLLLIAAPVRTAIGTFGGTLKDVPAPDLGAVAIRAAVESAGLRPDEVETVAMGNVIQAGKDESRSSGGDPCWPAGDGPGDDRQPRLRLGRAGDRVGGAGDPAR